MRLSRLVVLAAAVLAPAFAHADLLITVDKSTQRMTVQDNGALLYTWPVSTGMQGYDTPSGDYKPFRMERDHFSREWDDAPMPNSIFFTREGHAIHGSEHTKAIGRPASHGCVRLMPSNAAILFDLVKREGMNHTRVVLTGETPAVDAPIAKRNSPPRQPRRSVASVYEDDGGFTGAVPPPPPRRHWQRPPPPGWYYARPYYPRRYYYVRPYDSEDW